MSNNREIKKDQNNKEKKSSSIKLGLISQNSPYINVYELFNNYFEKTKPNPCKIKEEKYFEFSLLNLPQLPIIINHFKNIEDINDKYNIYNFFLIFIDLQNITTNTFLETTIDIIIEADESNVNKKCYIYGFFQNKENNQITEEKVTTLLESKGIEYYYNEIKIDDIESFSKLIECTINDCNNIMIEKYLAKKHSELVQDGSNSHCFIY